MEELNDLLKNPFDGLNPNDENGFINKCSDIAEKLLNNYCILCGEKKYHFAEVEFYYFDQNRFNGKWNEITYERNGHACELFYHLSGVDICFDGYLKKNKGKDKEKTGYGGGILIRSIWIKENNERIITIGPLTCVNKMLNACKNGEMPKLSRLHESEQDNFIPSETYRYLGNKDFKAILEKKNIDKDLKLAYYNPQISPAEWNKARSSYYKERIVKYNNHR